MYVEKHFQHAGLHTPKHKNLVNEWLTSSNKTLEHMKRHYTDE